MTEIDGFVLGVDLGTSHTVAMLRHPDGRTRPLLFDGQPLLPSAVYLDTTGRLHVGADALRLGHAEPGRIEPNPKRHVDDGSVLLGQGTSVPVADLLAALLGAVAREAVATAGLLPPAILTYPAAWGAPRRAVLTEALGKAGWPAETRLVPEPVAAARYFADVLRRPVPSGASLAVFDFGGGTLDVAVVRNEGPGPDGRPRFAVAASGGADDLGGLDLDAALVDHLAKSLAGAEPEAWRRLTEPATLAEWRARRQFWEDVRGAKEMLSRSSFAPVPVPGVEHAVHLTRDELEAAADPLVRRGVAEAGSVIAAAGLAAADLAGLFLVGGSSRVPMVARLLHSELGIAPTVLEQPELPVAEGAIIAAGAAVPARYATGVGTAATPTPTPATVSSAPPPLTDTRADPVAAPEPPTPPTSPPTTPPTAPAQGAPVRRAPEEVTDERLKAEPVDPWATGEAAALAAGGHPIVAPSAGATSAPPFGADRAAPFGAEQAAPPSEAAWPGPAAPERPGGPGSPAHRPTSPGGPSYPISPGSPAYPGTSGSPVYPGTPGSPAYPGTSGSPAYPGATGRPGYHGPPGSAGRNGPDASPAHPAAPGGRPPGATTPAAPPKGRRLGKRSYVIIASAVTVVLVAGAVLTYVLWPGYRAIDYHPLSDPKHVTPIVPVSSDWSDAEIYGDRVYFASSESESGKVGVVSTGLDASKPWSSLQAGTAPRWKSMLALPFGVALFTDIDSSTSTRRVAVLAAKDGTLLWQRTIANDDVLIFSGDTAVLADREGKRLIGLKSTDGTQRWSQPDPQASISADTHVFAATTPKDLGGPATVFGRAFEPDYGDDTRIVQIGADRSARVLDADTGKILTSRQNVADPDDEAIAHHGRLIVLQPDNQQIVSYDLGKFGEPRVLYTAQAQNSQMKDLTPCGDDRVCFDESVGYDGKTATVVSLNVADGTGWRYPLANTETIVPVGEALLVTTTTPDMTLIDAKGTKVWTRTGEAARLDGGNILEFSKPLSGSPGDLTLFGQHLGDDPVPLGAFDQVRSDTCGWDTEALACVTDKDFIIQRFAG